MTEQEMRAVGQERAQAFHEGLEAGMHAGIEYMRQCVLEYLEDRAKRNVFGNLDYIRSELKMLTVAQRDNLN